MTAARRLAAILAADVVGYSRLMGEDEAGTARLVRERREASTPIVRAFGGRLVKTTGDGVLLEFPSVVAAVECAIAIQKMAAERNAALPEAKRFLYRMGINLGDVLIEGDDILGDGVNVAARLEGICEPGAICLSEDAWRQARGGIAAEFADLGEQALKNIARPVRAHALTPAAIQSIETIAPSPAPGMRTLPRWPLVAAALASAFIVAGVFAWRAGVVPRLLGTASVAENKLKTAPQLSIVVLPFENLSGDKEQDYFADGITDDLTTDLSSHVSDFVIARNTAFTYKGKPVDAKEIGRELGVRYMLEGSVRRLGDKVEINAQLVSTETGAHVWADRFEGELASLGKLQFEVVSRLANSLGAELVKAEALRVLRERPTNPDAADFGLRGWAIIAAPSTAQNKTSWNEGVEMYERALSLDPQRVSYMVGLAIALVVRADNGWSEDRSGDLAHADELTNAAMALEPDNSWAHWTKGYIHSIKGQWKLALTETETAIADDHNNANAHARAGFYKMHLGRSQEGLADIDTAFRLSPRDPDASTWQMYRCYLRAHLAQWDKAVEECEKAVAARPSDPESFRDLASAYAWTGHDKDAKEILAKLRQTDPYFLGRHDESDDPTFKAESTRIAEGLRKAGSSNESSALAEAEAAISDDPSNAKAHADAGLYKMLLGRSADGVLDVEAALRLNPHDSDAPLWQNRLCYLRGHLAQWDQAIEQCEKAVATSPGDWGALANLTAAYAFASRDKDAKETLTRTRKANPNVMQDYQTYMNLHDDPTFKSETARVIEGLRKAGLPEGEKKAD